jgi:hypothetical protein
MSTLTQPRPAIKARRPLEPVFGVFQWHTPFDRNTGRLIISTCTGAAVYTISAIRSRASAQFGGHVAGYELVNEGNGEVYHVSLQAWGMDCTCFDFLIRQRDATNPAYRCCKHITALHAALKQPIQAA